MDENFYRNQVPLENFDKLTPAEHYLLIGWQAGIDPSPDFSTIDYERHNPDVVQSGMNPFVHYLKFGKDEGRPVSCSNATLTAISRIDLDILEAAMDADFYRSQAPGIDFSLTSPAAHYARSGWRAGLDPCRDFSTNGYLTLNPDVAKAGNNPFIHYLLTGRSENRLFSELQHPKDADGLSEWKGYEEVHGKARVDNGDPHLEALSFCVTLVGADLDAAIAPLRYDNAEHQSVTVSIIIPCLDQETLTAECLMSVYNALPAEFGIEVIVADNASTAPFYQMLSEHPSVRSIRFDGNIGFGPACNRAAEVAVGQYLFFLNNDAQIAPGTIEALVAAIENQTPSRPIGLVGPKLISFDGTLQEAGCRLHSDGTGSLVGFGKDWRNPRFSYDRAVEHVSGAAILIRRDLFLDLDGFDAAFAPAYCEDADLSLRLRGRGFEIRYVADALVAHHLSRTSQGLDGHEKSSKRQRVSRNRGILAKRWSAELARHNLRTVAFYLPQYHPVRENDLWWGKGFTEWVNTGKAKQNYVGHNQPRYPTDLGYYDLRVPSVMEQQAELARRYGVTGFCYYYYWFNGQKILEAPLERMLQSGKPDLPFCLCWANENWTRSWDGLKNDVLMSQSYSDEDSLAFIKDLTRYFRLPNYITIDGRPVVLIYRIKELPNALRTMAIWRNYCRAHGIGEICIVMVESFELSARPEDPRSYGCDITVEFPPHGMVTDNSIPVRRVNKDWTGAAHDYRELAANYMKRDDAGFPRLRSVLVGWDNSPRHQDRSLVLEHATPGAFQAWLEWTYLRTLEQNYGDERIVFINAWNEWCEGSYLEPDRRFGHAYLQAVSNALDNVRIGGGGFAQLQD